MQFSLWGHGSGRTGWRITKHAHLGFVSTPPPTCDLRTRPCPPFVHAAARCRMFVAWSHASLRSSLAALESITMMMMMLFICSFRNKNDTLLYPTLHVDTDSTCRDVSISPPSSCSRCKYLRISLLVLLSPLLVLVHLPVKIHRPCVRNVCSTFSF